MPSPPSAPSPNQIIMSHSSHHHRHTLQQGVLISLDTNNLVGRASGPSSTCNVVQGKWPLLSSGAPRCPPPNIVRLVVAARLPRAAAFVIIFCIATQAGSKGADDPADKIWDHAHHMLQQYGAERISQGAVYAIRRLQNEQNFSEGEPGKLLAVRECWHFSTVGRGNGAPTWSQRGKLDSRSSLARDPRAV